MRATEPPGMPIPRENCYRCFRPRSNCFCAGIRPFRPRTRIVLLMHPKENRKQRTGTGRLAHLCLEGSSLLVGDNFTGRAEIESLIADPGFYPVVLFPDEKARDITRQAPDVPDGRRLLVFVPDGTWRQARKILRQSANLQSLPRIRFSPPHPSRFLIKREPRPHCVSTIESIHFLLGTLEQWGLEPAGVRGDRLIEILDRLVGFQMKHTEGRIRIRSRSDRPGSPVPSAGDKSTADRG